MDVLRAEVVESIEVALVELRGIAQPHEMAAMSELRLDAVDAQSEDQLRAIDSQLKSLRQFCESRKQSDSNYKIHLPRGNRL